MTRLRTVNARKGFSLVELLIVVAISLIIGGAVLAALTSQFQLTATQNRNIINQENMRDVLRFMADEMQLLGNGASEPYVLTALAAEYDFIGDIDGDGDIDRIRYQQTGDAVTRTLYSTSDMGVSWTAVSTDIMVNGVDQITFTYFAIGDTVPASVNDITSVDIELQLDIDRGATSFTSGKVASQGMATRVTLRNRL